MIYGVDEEKKLMLIRKYIIHNLHDSSKNI